MKLNKYSIIACVLGLGSLGLTACSDAPGEITSKVYSRLLSPTDLKARVKGVQVELSWTAMPNAESYHIEVFNGTEPTGQAILSFDCTENKYTVTGLEGESVYIIGVQCCSKTIPASLFSYAQAETAKEQIFYPVAEDDITAKSVTLCWPAGEKATTIVLTPGDITYTVTADDIAAGCATIEGLTPETKYKAVLMNGSKTRGTVEFTTLIDFGDAIPVYSTDNFKQMLTDCADGTEFIIVEGEQHIGNFQLNKSVKISGFKPSARPVLHGRFAIAGDVNSLVLSNLIIDGNYITEDGTEGKSDNLFEMVSGKLVSFKMTGCDVMNQVKHVFYNNKKGDIGDVEIDNCMLYNMNAKGDGGGDGFDIRGNALGSLTVTNSTFANGHRSFVRNQASAGYKVTFANCTIYNIGFIDDGNNTGLFRMDNKGSFTATDLLVVNVGTAGAAAAYCGTWGRADKWKAETSFSNVVYSNCPNIWSSACADDHGWAAEMDPKFKDAANLDFTVTNDDVKDKKVGDPRWLK
ncbi:MAG: DUF5123 domain-containing protein [Bacteroidaceae bacterium]|nr:DUF5123 domain-containing protein [Bacteroidaceae bacterium]